MQFFPNMYARAYRTHLTLVSGNAKTGPIPVSTTERSTCPGACPFKANGCYADAGPLALHWSKVSAGERGFDWHYLCAAVAAFDVGTLWRHDQAGDLPGDGVLIDHAAMIDLVRANVGRRGFTYTHYSMEHEANRAAVRNSNACGFTVNVSANGMEDIDALRALDVGPVVTVLPIDYQRRMIKGAFVESLADYRERMTTLPLMTEAGARVVVCPATYRDDVTCASCQLCQRQRDSVVGFPAHGTSARKASDVASGARRVIAIARATNLPY